MYATVIPMVTASKGVRVNPICNKFHPKLMNNTVNAIVKSQRAVISELLANLLNPVSLAINYPLSELLF